jgi:sporulation protein YlmC with PRC-barrel domain
VFSTIDSIRGIKLAEKERLLSKNLIGKTVVSKSGKRFGEVGDMAFETRTGEIIFVILDKPTSFAASFELEKDSKGRYQIPYHAVVAVGDFVVVAEEDIL